MELSPEERDEKIKEFRSGSPVESLQGFISQKGWSPINLQLLMSNNKSILPRYQRTR